MIEESLAWLRQALSELRNQPRMMSFKKFHPQNYEIRPEHRSLPSPAAIFLRTSTVIASATALGALDISRSAHAAGSDTLKVGMIGCGGRNSGAIVQALTADPGARLVAMCDIFRDRVEGKREEIKKAKGEQVSVDDAHCFTGFDGYKQVIESSDVVLIANAAKFHPFHALSAIQAGKHVFVEKPHGIDPRGIKLMQQACDLAKEKKLCIVSGLHSRFHAGYAETIQKIQDGAIGQIVTIEENFLRSPYGVTERKPGLSELEWQCSTQYHFRWLSGDDVPQSLRAQHGPRELGARQCGSRQMPRLGRPLHACCEPVYGDVFDHHSVVYEFENGVRAYALCRTTTGCYDEDSSLIFGTKGKASVKACRIWGEKNWRWQGQCDPYQIEHDKLFAGIRARQPDQLRSVHGAQHDDHRDGSTLLLHRQGDYLGADQSVRVLLSSQAGRLSRWYGTAHQA